MIVVVECVDGKACDLNVDMLPEHCLGWARVMTIFLYDDICWVVF